MSSGIHCKGRHYNETLRRIFIIFVFFSMILCWNKEALKFDFLFKGRYAKIFATTSWPDFTVDFVYQSPTGTWTTLYILATSSMSFLIRIQSLFFYENNYMALKISTLSVKVHVSVYTAWRKFPSSHKTKFENLNTPPYPLLLESRGLLSKHFRVCYENN